MIDLEEFLFRKASLHMPVLQWKKLFELNFLLMNRIQRECECFNSADVAWRVLTVKVWIGIKLKNGAYQHICHGNNNRVAMLHLWERRSTVEKELHFRGFLKI